MNDQKMYRVNCDPTCGFMVQSHDRKEAAEIGTKHANDKHNMDVSIKDTEEKIEEID